MFPYIIIIKVFIKRKILSVDAILNAYTHTHTLAPAHTSILTIAYRAKFTQLETGTCLPLSVCRRLWELGAMP